MSDPVPDLWLTEADARRLYQLYLAHLSKHDLHDRCIIACRQIRRHAARGPGRVSGLFSFSIEVDSLCELKEYEEAWRALRRRERVMYGHRIDPSTHKWSAQDAHELVYSYAPVLFFLKRYREGRQLLETGLGFWFGGDEGSYYVLFHVLNNDAEPADRCRVTLAHFYSRLGKDLREWNQWDAFVRGLHPRLFDVSHVSQEELLVDPGQLTVFNDRLMRLLRERTPSGVTSGQADLIDGADKVAARQAETQQERERFHDRSRTQREQMYVRLLSLFPDLQGLPRD